MPRFNLIKIENFCVVFKHLNLNAYSTKLEYFVEFKPRNNGLDTRNCFIRIEMNRNNNDSMKNKRINKGDRE